MTGLVAELFVEAVKLLGIFVLIALVSVYFSGGSAEVRYSTKTGREKHT